MHKIEIICSMVAVVVLRGSGNTVQMLLAQRQSAYLDGVWSYIAGHIDAGESAWQAALRELREETGLHPQFLHATSVCEQFYDQVNDCIQVVPAFVAFVPDEASVHLNHEHRRYQWLSLQDASRCLPFGSQRDVLQHIEREFLQRSPHPALQINVTS